MAVYETTYPKIVRQMLIKRSAPQPATIKVPTGGTTGQPGLAKGKKRLLLLLREKEGVRMDENIQSRVMRKRRIAEATAMMLECDR